MSSTVRIIDNYGNDSFIKSIAVLKQLLLQSAKEETVIQHEKSTTEDKDEEPQDIVVDVEAKEPSISEDTAVAVCNVVTTDQTNNHENEETMNNNETNVDVNEDQHQQLQLKLANAEKDVLTERALRASLEKAFDDLSVHRKLLQEQIDHLLYQQQQYNNSQQNEEQDASLKNTSLFVSDVEDFTVSKMNDVTTDSNEQPNSSTNDTVEAQTMDIERSDDNTRNQEESQEKSISLETEHERVTETTSSHDVLQSKFDALQEEYNNLQQKYEQMIADSGSYKDDSNPESSSSLGMIDSGKQSEEQDLSRKDELESLRKERGNIIQFLLHHSRTSISMVRL